MKTLQDLLDQTDHHRTIHTAGMGFQIDRQVTIDKPVRLVAFGSRATVVDYDRHQFPNSAALFIRSPDVRIEGLDLRGPGRTRDELAGIRSIAARTEVHDCYASNFEYALYFLSGERSQLVRCGGHQDFEPPWNGLDYGIVLHDARGALVQDCSVRGTRHALVFGEHSQGVADHCVFSNTANVQAVAFKPTSRNCTVSNCQIVGGVNIGGIGQRILGNAIHGRDEYPQPSTPIYAPKSTLRSFRHDVVGNRIVARSVPRGSAFYGVCYINLPQGEGTMWISDNRFEVRGTAPVIAGKERRVDFVRNTVVRT